MDEIRAVLAEVARLDREATPGPWPELGIYRILKFWCRNSSGEAVLDDEDGGPWDIGGYSSNAPYIAASRTLLPRLAVALAVAVEHLSVIRPLGHAEKMDALAAMRAALTEEAPDA